MKFTSEHGASQLTMSWRFLSVTCRVLYLIQHSVNICWTVSSRSILSSSDTSVGYILVIVRVL